MMKFLVTFKTPDALEESIREAVLESMENLHSLSEREQEAAAKVRYEIVAEKCCRWFEHGEYVTVEVDTDAGTCVVVPVRA